MLCLKAEALDDDKTLASSSSSSSPSSDRSNGGNQPSKENSNGGFVLPINWGDSIQRYLKKAGKISRRSLSSGDGSPSFSDFEGTKTRDEGNVRGAKSKSQHQYQLEEDVKKLQQQLQEEINLRLALSSAVEHSDSLFSDSPFKLPDKAQELLDAIAILEITVSKLEQESVSLQYQLNQERNKRRLAEYRLKNPPSSAASMSNNTSAYFEEMVTSKRIDSDQRFVADRKILQAEGRRSSKDDLPPWQTIVTKQMVESLWHHPNQLSEEMVKCMRDIFLFLAKYSKNQCSEFMASNCSPKGLKNSLNSILDSPILNLLGRSHSVDSNRTSEVPERDSMFNPYEVPGKMEWTSSIGAYSKAVEAAWFDVGKSELEYATCALKRYRVLVEQLAKVGPSCMSCNEKLAFWINIYNALIMHAYLAYGVPTSNANFSSLMQKSAYSIGGHSFSVADIEYISLKIQRPIHRPHIASGLAFQKSKISEQLKKYSIDDPEPLLSFALSCGMHSSPAVRIIRPENVKQALKRSLRDYVQASIGINDRGKLAVPKLLHGFAKVALLDDALLPAWVCQLLTAEQASAVNECLAKHKWRLLGAKSYAVVAFDTRFRFLFLIHDEDYVGTNSEMCLYSKQE